MCCLTEPIISGSLLNRIQLLYCHGDDYDDDGDDDDDDGDDEDDDDDEEEDEDEKVCGWLAEDEGWRQVQNHTPNGSQLALAYHHDSSNYGRGGDGGDRYDDDVDFDYEVNAFNLITDQPWPMVVT